RLDLHSFPTRRSSDLVGVVGHRGVEMYRDRDLSTVGCDGHVPVAAGGDRGHVVIDRGEVLRPVAPEARAEDVLALADAPVVPVRSEEHTSELQSPCNL